MIHHVVPAADWAAAPAGPYAPASLDEDGFVHCSPDDRVTLAVADAFYRAASRPLLVLDLDEARLTAPCVWEEAAPVPPPGVPEGTRFPHVYGPLDRDAVVRVREIVWDARGRATGLRDAG
ncbi:DUF952 domain-containing protein [Streptomyces pharetrae]|uniref:DUF952 domain-containing protein n=1 Tax=Streptomyces pharetrae TaxID=291370 RepID=UPI003356D6CC